MNTIHGTASYVCTQCTAKQSHTSYIHKALTIRNLINAMQWMRWKKESNFKEQKDVLSYKWKYYNIILYRIRLASHICNSSTVQWTESILVLFKKALLQAIKCHVFDISWTYIFSLWSPESIRTTNFKCVPHTIQLEKKKWLKNLFW